MIIVTLTSWTARIHNVVPVLSHFLEHQSVLPDEVVINLSEEEFADVELPAELTKFLEENPIVHINWVPGPNTRQWKKIIPTLLSHPNDVVICIDDDMTYKYNLIEVLLKTHEAHPDHPITGNRGYKVHGLLQHCGCCSLDMLRYYPGLEKIDITEFSHLASSDTFFTLLAHEGGNDPVPVCEKITWTSYNPVRPLSFSEGTCKPEKHEEMYAFMQSKGIISK